MISQHFAAEIPSMEADAFQMLLKDRMRDRARIINILKEQARLLDKNMRPSTMAKVFRRQLRKYQLTRRDDLRAVKHITTLGDSFEGAMALGDLVVAVARRDFEEKYGKRSYGRSCLDLANEDFSGERANLKLAARHDQVHSELVDVKRMEL